MKTILILTFTLFTLNAHAGKYTCSFDKINLSSGTADHIGSNEIDSVAPGLKKITINDQGDVGGCGFTKPTQGTFSQKQSVMCIFSAKADLAMAKNLDPRNPKSVLALRRTRLFGQVTSLPVAHATDGAESVGLLLPNPGLSVFYSAECTIHSK